MGSDQQVQHGHSILDGLRDAVVRAAQTVQAAAPRPLVIVFAAVVAHGAACVSTTSTVRVLDRAGAARDRGIAIAHADPVVAVDVGRVAATDAEVAALNSALAAHLAARVGTASDNGPAVGTARIVRATLKASPGREQHRYLATCRLRVDDGDGVVADVEAETLRLVRARNVSVIELDGLQADMVKNGGRLSLLTSEDVTAAAVAACDAAFDAAAHDVRPDDVDVDAEHGAGAAHAARALRRKNDRRRALEKLAAHRSTADVAAALVDVGNVGDVDDAPAVAAHLADKNALVRRAATLAFRQLCTAQPVLAPAQSAACVPPPPPADAAENDHDDGVGAAVFGAPRAVAGQPDDDADNDNDNDDDDDNDAPTGPPVPNAPIVESTSSTSTQPEAQP